MNDHVCYTAVSSCFLSAAAVLEIFNIIWRKIVISFIMAPSGILKQL